LFSHRLKKIPEDLFPPVGKREETVSPKCKEVVAAALGCYTKLMARAAQIRRYSDQLARCFRPRKIILFGSHVSRKATEESDVDLLVVMSHQGPAATQAARIRQQLRAPFALDLIVRSPEVLQRRIKLGDSFLRGIMSEGKVLYESTRSRVGSKSHG